MKRRILALLLAAITVCALLPTAGAAAGTDLTCAQMIALLPAAPKAANKPTSFHEAIFSCNYSSADELESIYNDGYWELSLEMAAGREQVFQSIRSTTESVIAGKTSQTEKAKAIYQWVAKNIKYDYAGLYDFENLGIYDPFSTFYHRKGVCEGYATLSSLMLSIAGLPSALITGSAKGGGPHAWTAVHADGRWLLFDATWGEWNISANYHDSIDQVIYRAGTVCKAYTCEGNSIFLYDAQNGGRIVIPEDATEVEYEAFRIYTNEFTLSFSKQIFSRSVFQSSDIDGCDKLVKLELPAGTTAIEGQALCAALKEIYLPAELTRVSPHAFRSTPLTDIYYGGTAEQWAQVDLTWGNEALEGATVHFNCTPSTQPLTAYASTQNVLVDGRSVAFPCYALKDENGYMTNYIKLRDVASVLNGTAAQFNVGWNGAVNIETGAAYIANGSEMHTPFSGDRAYETATAATNVNGKRAELDAFVLKDDTGSGYTYYKLRDLGAALGFTVDWSTTAGISIKTT